MTTSNISDHVEVSILVETDGPSTAVPVAVAYDRRATAGQLMDSLTRVIGRSEVNGPLCVRRSGAQLQADTPLADLELRDGDILTASRASLAPEVAGHPLATRGSWQLLVESGPCAGIVYDLDLSDRPVTIGRGDQATILVPDPSISSVHASLQLRGDQIWISDMGSTNGTAVEGRPIGTEPTALSPGAVANLGGSLLTVRPSPVPALLAPSYQDGRLLVNRPPRAVPPSDPPVISLPVPPKPPTKARLPILTALIPLALGVVIAEVAHNAMFLMFAVLSPVMAVISVVSDRRSGKSAHKKAMTRFARQVERVRTSADEAHLWDLQVQRSAAPGPADLAQRAIRLEQPLWERRGTDDDFLRLRVGLADRPARLRFDGAQPPDPDRPPGPLDAIQDDHKIDPSVPVTVPLGEGVLGISGPDDDSSALARSLILGAACLHSPRDLAIVALVPAQREAAWQFLAWMPHTSVLLPSASTVSTSAEDHHYLLGLVDEVVRTRQEPAGGGFGAGKSRHMPHVLLVIAGDMELSRPMLSRVLESGPAVGVTALVVSEAVRSLPGECTHFVTLSSTPENAGELSLVQVREGVTIDGILADLVPVRLVEKVALALAPLRDVTAGGRGSELPRQVNLLELLALEDPTPEGIASRWARSRIGLPGIIGVNADGPQVLDLQREGPHMLVGGTTGAGKSELLQTFVAALAASHPPERLTFVLIDYKGGAAFKECTELPHVTGYFTDLDGHLARRALESLEAEVRRREHLLAAAGYKNLIDFEQGDPEHAPPSLLLVFDEFAFLKTSVPEFVDGVVDIAARGRSLGVHLVLATQRPAGIIDDKIRTNVPVRISLRFHDDQESVDVLTVPDAARIPDDLVGRAFIRSGSDIHPVQVAYVGGQRSEASSEPVVNVRPIAFGPSPISWPKSEADRSGESDLQRLVAAVCEAWSASGSSLPRRPWLDPLATSYSLATLASESIPRERLSTVAGVVDRPESQSQDPLVLDFDELGHLLVFGTGGSGKTTLLRTIAAGLSERWSASDLNLYGLDFATRGLQAIEALPQCGGVATASDIERAERILALLERIVAERQVALGSAAAGSFMELRSGQPEGQRSPWVVLLLDGYSGFVDVFGDLDAGAQIDRLAQIAADGSSVGVHLVISVDRRGGVPNRLLASIPGRVILRMGDADEYQWLGLRNVGDADLPPGRGFLSSGAEIHVAVLGDDASGRAQVECIKKLGAALSASDGQRAPSVEVLGDDIPADVLPAPVSAMRRIPFAIDGADLRPMAVRLDENPTFLICGPDGSGRSVALATLARGLRAAFREGPMVLLAPRRTPLTALDTWTSIASGQDEVYAAVLDMVASSQGSSVAPTVVIIDDAEELLEGPVADHLEKLVRKTREQTTIICAACQTHRAHRAYAGWLSEMRKAKHGLVIMPDVDVDGDLFGVRFPRRSTVRFPPGRGYLAQRSGVSLVQVAR